MVVGVKCFYTVTFFLCLHLMCHCNQVSNGGLIKDYYLMAAVIGFSSMGLELRKIICVIPDTPGRITFIALYIEMHVQNYASFEMLQRLSLVI